VTLWIVGKVWSHRFWEYQGIFDDEQMAVDACEDDNWFIGPVKMNEKVPVQCMDWPGAYFPLAEKVKL